MQSLLTEIAAKKSELDWLRPLSSGALAQLQKYYDVELTYTSNAIEGNTLTHRETAEVIEHGITVAGKPLRDHLEAQDHYEALLWMREIAAQDIPPGEGIICDLHRRSVARSQPLIAGQYSPYARRIAGSPVIFPNPLKIPELMEELDAWIKAAPATPETAFTAHFHLTAIPFQRWQWPHGAAPDEFDVDPRRLSTCRPASRRSKKLSRCAGASFAKRRFATVSAAVA